MAANPKATILKLFSGGAGWEISVVAFDPQTIPSVSENCYFFLDSKGYPAQEALRHELLGHFNVPKFVTNRACTELNGYFGCRATYDDENKVKCCSTWFRCLVKMVLKVKEDPHENGPEYVQSEEYRWFEMGIFTRWDYPRKCQVLCVNTPDDLPSELKKALEKRPAFLDFRDPFAMHVDLIDQIMIYYDISVWRVRDLVRALEKARVGVGEKFEQMHEISRHAIHTSEILSATIETMTEMQRYQTEIHENLSAGLGKNYREQAKEYTGFQIQLVKNLKFRSESNQKRLENEINLAFNNIAHQDNTIIKSIAVLTMTFLPATFFSALFSTTFFTFGTNGWEASSRFWVYWAITVPTTIVVIIIWRVWSWSLVQKFLGTLSWDMVRRGGKKDKGNHSKV